jgi:hypothetical protein
LAKYAQNRLTKQTTGLTKQAIGLTKQTLGLTKQKLGLTNPTFGCTKIRMLQISYALELHVIFMVLLSLHLVSADGIDKAVNDWMSTNNVRGASVAFYDGVSLYCLYMYKYMKAFIFEKSTLLFSNDVFQFVCLFPFESL